MCTTTLLEYTTAHKYIHSCQTWRHRSLRSAHHLEQRFDVCMHRVHRGLRRAKAVPQLVDILLRIGLGLGLGLELGLGLGLARRTSPTPGGMLPRSAASATLPCTSPMPTSASVVTLPARIVLGELSLPASVVRPGAAGCACSLSISRPL